MIQDVTFNGTTVMVPLYMTSLVGVLCTPTSSYAVCEGVSQNRKITFTTKSLKVREFGKLFGYLHD